MEMFGRQRLQPGKSAAAQQHLTAAQLVAKQLSERVTRERVRAWAYHMKMMLADRS